MLTGKFSSLRWLVSALLLALALAACVNNSPAQIKLTDHSFSFDGYFDKWDEIVDLLEYSYGDQYHMAQGKVKPPKERLRPQWGVNGSMPVGEFLYVKWRIKTTGEVLEDRVDLRPLLPKDMTDYGLTFVPDGKQLYVYLITPIPKHEDDPPLLKTTKSRYSVTYEIYPHNTFPFSQR
jgi:hypothetical protein